LSYHRFAQCVFNNSEAQIGVQSVHAMINDNQHIRLQSNNLKNMFGINAIPSDVVLRKNIDVIDTEDINGP
jgi:hypothetical protein